MYGRPESTPTGPLAAVIHGEWYYKPCLHGTAQSAAPRGQARRSSRQQDSRGAQAFSVRYSGSRLFAQSLLATTPCNLELPVQFLRASIVAASAEGTPARRVQERHLTYMFRILTPENSFFGSPPVFAMLVSLRETFCARHFCA